MQRYHVIDAVDDDDVIGGVTSSVGGTLSRRGPSIDRQSVDDSAVLESSLRPGDMDLMNDPDIMNICRKSLSLENICPDGINISSSSTSSSVGSEDDVSIPWVRLSHELSCHFISYFVKRSSHHDKQQPFRRLFRN